ncbi:MAG: sigma-70 family RNA polymerase sigma factor [Anaerolineaceae bacterium]|nr:sigma-70 family RNA polymerase sigma factor [Anaerolineaceae bacterium]
MAQTEKTRLRQFIEYESSTLLGTLRFYLYRAGLQGRDLPLDAAAQDLLNEVVEEALQHENRFRTAGQPKAWLLGIAANLVKRRQQDMLRRERREPLIRDLHPEVEAQMSDDELFDWFANVAATTTDAFDHREDVELLLTALSADDEHVLRLAIMNGLDGVSLAKALKITPGAARVRLHRALGRLREVYTRQQENDHA